jgi:hypothetical protein
MIIREQLVWINGLYIGMLITCVINAINMIIDPNMPTPSLFSICFFGMIILVGWYTLYFICKPKCDGVKHGK